jgi:chemotaxis protein methyltransferase CheR
MTMAGTSGKQFEAVLRYILDRTGIRLPETKYKALGDYLQDFGDDLDFGSFTRHVEGAGAEDFLGAVTINETYFFREQRHFSLLHSGLLAFLAARSKPVKIWSAACSSGEEALSLAAMAWSLLGEGGARVYASDISPQVLARFRKGLYGHGSLREDGKIFHELLEPFMERTDKDFRIRPSLLDSIATRVVNLSDTSYASIPDGLDLVFMRNVLMYMPMDTRHRILGTVSNKLAEGGFIFVSSSEIPHLAHPDLALKEREGCFYFQKKDSTEKRKGMIVTGDSFRKHEPPSVPCEPPLGRFPAAPDATSGAGAPQATAAIVTRVAVAEANQVAAVMETQTTPATREAQSSLVSGAEAAKFATLRLNNPLFEDEGNPAFEAAIHYLEVMYRLNSGSLDGLEAYIQQGEANWGLTSISAYFRGLAASASNEAGNKASNEAGNKASNETGNKASNETGNKASNETGNKASNDANASTPGGKVYAEAAYREALGLDGLFWPARLNLAMLLRDREPRSALMELKVCSRDIEAYIYGQEYQYQFLLEGFNAKYFLDLCQGWIRKLQSRGAGHGS